MNMRVEWVSIGCDGRVSIRYGFDRAEKKSQIIFSRLGGVEDEEV